MSAVTDEQQINVPFKFSGAFLQAKVTEIGSLSWLSSIIFLPGSELF